MKYTVWSLVALVALSLSAISVAVVANKRAVLQYLPSYVVPAPADGRRCFTALVNGEESTICRVGRRGDERQ